MNTNGKPRVLIIDDEDALRGAVKRILEREGYQVATAENGSRGIELGTREEYDLALIDLKMPDYSGIDVLKEIRRQKPNTVCFIVTAYASYETAVEATKMGADGYILKPFTPEELLNHLTSGYKKRLLILEAEALKHEREERLLEIAFERTRLNTVINSLADGVLVVNTDGEVVYYNNAAMTLLNLHDVVIGRPILEELPAEIREIIFTNFTVNVTEKKSFSVEVELKPKHELVVEATLSPVLRHNGQLSGVVIVLKNISTFKKVEHLKSQFVSMVAHELKAPVAATLGFLNIILNKEMSLTRDQELDFLSRSRHRLASLLNMVNDLLDISRIEMKTITREIRELNLNNIITETLSLFTAEIKKKDLSILYDQEGLQITIRADYSEISRLITNFISNAIKYNKQSGTVDIKCYAEKHYSVFEIADTGIGMRPEEKDKLFSEFYRAKNEFTKDITGTGLGLSIVKRIIDAYSGKIEVESKYTEGTRFRVFIPMDLNEDEINN
ncbi:MAG: response regulator [Ignavibacteriaceae bacterium]|nr:response regulator [Ignavibacteriaceae bacterium]